MDDWDNPLPMRHIKGDSNPPVGGLIVFVVVVVLFLINH